MIDKELFYCVLLFLYIFMDVYLLRCLMLLAIAFVPIYLPFWYFMLWCVYIFYLLCMFLHLVTNRWFTFHHAALVCATHKLKFGVFSSVYNTVLSLTCYTVFLHEEGSLTISETRCILAILFTNFLLSTSCMLFIFKIKITFTSRTAQDRIFYTGQLHFQWKLGPFKAIFLCF